MLTETKMKALYDKKQKSLLKPHVFFNQRGLCDFLVLGEFYCMALSFLFEFESVYTPA